MKKSQIMIIAIVSIVVIVMISVGVFIENLNNNPSHLYTDVTITGLKENYTLNEDIIFSVILEGYGTGCGYVNETIAKDDQQIYSTFGGSTPCNNQLHYFKFNAGSSSINANLPGNYTLRASFYDTVTFQHASTKKNFSITLPKIKEFTCTDPTQQDLQYDNNGLALRQQIEKIVLDDPIIKKIIDNSYCEFMGQGTLYTENGTYKTININLNNTKELSILVRLNSSSVVHYELGELTKS